MVVAIPYRMGPDNGAELRFTLRSIAKYTDAQTVILIGECPVWASVVHVPVMELHGGKGNVYRSTAHKAMLACLRPEVGDELLWMADDMPFVNPVSAEDLKLARSNVDMNRKVDWRKLNPTASAEWKKVMQASWRQLYRLKLPRFGYETHTPRLYNKWELMETIERHGLLSNPMHLATMHYNTHRARPDRQTTADFKGKVVGGWTPESVNARITEVKHLNWQQKEWGPELHRFMQGLLPDKCRFEK
jgi:hypothetical protein